MDFKLEHLLLFVVAIFLLYHLLGGCGCANGVVEGLPGDRFENLTTKCFSGVSLISVCGRQGVLANNQGIINSKIDNLTFIYNAITGELEDIKGRLRDIKNRLPS